MAENWRDGARNLENQMKAMQGSTNLYQYGPNPASLHIRNIARSLAKDYGINSISDIGVREVPYSGMVPITEGVDENQVITGYERVEGTSPQYFNKNNNKTIPGYKFASENTGKGYSEYNLQVIPGSGGLVVPVQRYSLSGFDEFAADAGPLLVVAGVALQLIPGVGTTIGSAILGGASSTVAASIGATVGLTATQVATAVGAATIASGTAVLQGGSVEDVIKAGLSAGAASGVNFAAGGGITGAAAGSAVGTVIQGGNASQVLTNALAAGVGAGVQGAMTKNPDAGKIVGSAVRTYIATGGDMDKTLLNTSVTALGTLDNPAKTEQQAQTASTSAKISESLVRFEDGGLLYEEQPDGTGKVTDQAGNEKIISRSEFSRIANAEYTAPPVTTPSTTSATELERQNVTAPATAPVVSPVVTDLDLVRQVAEQPTPAVGATELERVIVQGQREANVAPVVTDLERVTVGELTVPPATEPPTPPSDETKVKTEEPKKEEEPKEKPKEEPKKYYPTVTTVPPPKRPGRQPIITGESPSRLLADSLAAYRPAGAIEGEESGKERQNVWNEKSLRLKDALGL